MTIYAGAGFIRRNYEKINCLLLFIFMTLVLFTGCNTAQTQDSDAKVRPFSIETLEEDFELSFSDDFDTFDTSKWEKCPEWQRQNVGGYWKDEYSFTENGNLVIKCGLEKGIPYSGAVRTSGKFEQGYGVYKIRFKVHKASGLWFAFWLMGHDQGNSGEKAVNGAEIDIFEVISNAPWKSETEKQYLNTACHWDGYGDSHGSAGFKHFIDDSFYDVWHEEIFVWEKDGYSLFLDGELIWESDGSDFGGICTKKNYMKITAEFGTWNGDIIESELPAYMYVDSVKVYKRK